MPFLGSETRGKGRREEKRRRGESESEVEKKEEKLEKQWAYLPYSKDGREKIAVSPG